MAKTTKTTAKKTTPQKEICGIVMPISAIDGCSETHWSDVMEILSESIEDAGFIPNIVSNADEVGIIQKRIIQNLYDNPIVVCDVSGKNPNVMFELGIRLAFDKPTIIVKDDKTTYSFDTSPIEHLEYPRDLRFGAIVEFKEKLKEKILKTYQSSKENTDYTTFLKHFGEFKVAKIEKKEVSEQEFILDEIKNLRSLIETSNKRQSFSTRPSERRDSIEICCRSEKLNKVEELSNKILKLPFVKDTRIKKLAPNHLHLSILLNDDSDRTRVRSELKKLTNGIYNIRIH